MISSSGFLILPTSPFVSSTSLQKMSDQTTEEQLQTALKQINAQQQRIHDLEKEVQRCKSKEEMVNEYAGSMHDKLTEKDAVVGMKEARIEYLEGRYSFTH